MHPVLWRLPEWIPLLGGQALHTYGLMIALGFLLGWQYTQKETKRLGLNPDHMADFFFYMVLCALLGSRVLYIINSVDDFWSDPWLLFKIWEGGLVFQGGILGALIFSVIYARRVHFKFFQIADIFSVPLSLGHGLGRLGCFFAGCCYGKPCPTDFIFGITFTGVAGSVAPSGIKLYPTQLTEAFIEFFVFLFLLYYRKKKPFEGAVFLIYMMIYAVVRSFTEIYRGDGIRGFVVEPYFSVAQLISVLAFLGAMVTWLYLSKKERLKTKG